MHTIVVRRLARTFLIQPTYSRRLHHGGGIAAGSRLNFITGNLMRLKILVFLALTISYRSNVCAQTSPGNPGTTALIRCDDIGMCHTVNVAAKQVFDAGIPVSASVMFACPWYQEAVELLKHYPHVSVGVHLTLNAEWKNYRWGPISGRSAVPSLVDSLGYFFPSRASFFANHPKIDEVEKELRAQIERAVHSGLHIDYLDYHMGTVVDRPEFRALLESLAREYRLAISRYFGEEDVQGVYQAAIPAKLDTLLAHSRLLEKGPIHLFVFHVGLQSPELDALEDLNTFGPKEMSKHRQAELKALTSPLFTSLLHKRQIRLTTYRDLVSEKGLGAMKRPIEKE
jgi:chitin disaccharide deacetylase